MKASVEISAKDVTSHESAAISLCADGAAITELYLDFSRLLKSVPRPTDRSLDFLIVASAIYSLDKLTPRSESENGWERSFDVSVPVKNSAVWSKATKTINECLTFLSGDRWSLSFTERSNALIHRKRRKRRSRIPPRYAKGEVACLFSGGLDSLIGAIGWLESNNSQISLVGHHDPKIGGVKKDQEQLVKALELAYPNRFDPVLVGVGNTDKSPEITMRSRSLLFIALGVVVAAHLGDGTELLIPENGTIALNVPLTPARRGTCSTRTAHPHYLSLLQKWLSAVGLNHPVRNPLIGKTKGEAASECANLPLLAQTALMSTSCAKPGHTFWWVRRKAKGCGQCMPCIYRRAALHKAGLDTEVYGNDFCAGEVDVTDPQSDAADDFRACLSFLRKHYNREDIAKLLISAGPLPPLEVLDHADTVGRAMEEIRQLLRDKATGNIQKMAGI